VVRNFGPAVRAASSAHPTARTQSALPRCTRRWKDSASLPRPRELRKGPDGQSLAPLPTLCIFPRSVRRSYSVVKSAAPGEPSQRRERPVVAHATCHAIGAARARTTSIASMNAGHRIALEPGHALSSIARVCALMRRRPIQSRGDDQTPSGLRRLPAGPRDQPAPARSNRRSAPRVPRGEVDASINGAHGR
jgi:hypothetical protein